MSTSPRTEAEAVAEIALASRQAKLIELTPEVDAIAIPNGEGGVTVTSIKALVDEYRTAPDRRKGIARLSELDSFIAHTNRFKDVDSAIFALSSTPCLTAVIDYHRAGHEGAPRFGGHRAVYEFPVSDEWTAWNEKNGEAMSQADFAEFLEDRILDVADPATATEGAQRVGATLGATFAAPARLLELSRGLTVNVGARVTNAANLGTGESTMQFVTQHSDERGAPLKVPGAFLVTLPVFENGALYQLAARLRYRVRDGGVSWSFELHNASKALDDAFREACVKAKTDTGLPLFFGSPE